MLTKGSTAMEGLSGRGNAILSLEAGSTVVGAERRKKCHIVKAPAPITIKAVKANAALGHFL
jgi:hypothetical protein